MKFLFAPDSFKGSLTSIQAAQIMRDSARAHFPDAEMLLCPIADGGEGTVDALMKTSGGITETVRVRGPLGAAVDARLGWLNEKSAVVEMAQASGLTLVKPAELDPLSASSFGTGQLILAALKSGAKSLLIGIGGSATSDGGMGMLAALGARFLSQKGCELEPSGTALERVAKIDLSGLSPLIDSAQLTVICDVSNPLLGQNGAVNVYAPQKGADAPTRARLENGMKNYAERFLDMDIDIASFPGAGAAGGAGGVLGGVLKARLKQGIDAVLDAVDFDNLLAGVDLVITGEGRMDAQSIQYGKAPVGVARRAAGKGVPAFAVVGSAGEGADAFTQIAGGAVISAVNTIMSVEEAMANAETLLFQAVGRLMISLKAGMRLSERLQ